MAGASSAVVMPYLGIAKQRLADQLGSPAPKGEGSQNMLCAYLAGALLLGLLRQRARRRLVARPGRRPPDRRARRQGGPRGLARRGLLRQRPLPADPGERARCDDDCCA
jgi:hypothetical protein